MNALKVASRMSVILIIEDHKEFRKAMKNFIILKGVQAQIHEASTGQEGIEMALRERPRLVIVDINLGIGINGLDTASAIKHQDPSCAVIILTMYSLEGMKELYKTKDIEEVIDKSDLDVRLVPAINRLLSKVSNTT